MAKFTLKKHTVFTFDIEGVDKEFEIPAIGALSFEDVADFTSVSNTSDTIEQGNACKKFILKFAPDVEKLGIGDMDYVTIFNAYALSQKEDKETPAGE